MSIYILRRQKERYGDIGKELPSFITCLCTRDQAEEVAKRLNSYYPGCDQLFYVTGEDRGVDDE